MKRLLLVISLVGVAPAAFAMDDRFSSELSPLTLDQAKTRANYIVNKRFSNMPNIALVYINAFNLALNNVEKERISLDEFKEILLEVFCRYIKSPGEFDKNFYSNFISAHLHEIN